MKQIVFGIACLGIVILAAAGILTLERRSVRENEMDNALGDSVQQVLDALVQSGKYSIEDDETLIAAFNQSLLAELNAGTKKDGEWIEDGNLNITVDVTGVDIKKGLLSVRVRETFTHPNGNIGTVVCDATAVFEQKEAQKMHTVTFLNDGQIYMQYRVAEGNAFMLPAKPRESDRNFAGWIDEGTGTSAVFPAAVFADQRYIAVFQ